MPSGREIIKGDVRRRRRMRRATEEGRHIIYLFQQGRATPGGEYRLAILFP